MTSPTPKVLTEADAAADLAGLPRAVSTYDVQLMAAKLDDMVANPWSASAMLIVLVSERDALAGRVAELEAALQRSLSWLSSYPGGGTLLPNGPYEQARAALAATPESKP